jgi:hypothetical protein
MAFIACKVSSDIAKVKYLGGITFLLKDRCPEYASDFEISNYKQCAENEILHVSILT